MKTTAGALELERPRVRNVSALGFCSEIVGKGWRALAAPAALHKGFTLTTRRATKSLACGRPRGRIRAVRDSRAQLLSMARATAHDEHRTHGAVGDALADAAQ